ncbi:hypothetical protein LMJF_14_1155 [Leishmania major strain Friedlin]|uniref:Uncharacterized protein n=1 Tax=Leishmania major TaxID=5664 RepID=E9ACR5_LEIMA|nr:hypothetical protein LMJF_14_1155 [Leishmania major strain Friedlin]CAG9571309.1 hypothetical_protein_-_conserved [Leishmania major strain Friedlin]CBZ05812.1 hypothetical protein LMJF_14_1155 [Leishmania major strain Friedlin]|eukprot:XP_003721789.1 hypothetical protein LMJF_14_1155 [Leishmania major strain Friedlin]
MRRLRGSAHLTRHWTRRAEPHCSGVICGSRSITSTPTASSSTSSGTDAGAAGAARLARAAEIRRKELLFRWLRRLVVPAFSIYGLFLLRPTEGHFLRYVAERRHLDASFNAWFPPVTVGSPTEPGSKVEPAKRAPTATNTSSPTGGAGANGGASSMAPGVIPTVFRSERDREWAAQRFNYKKGSDDEERVARKRLLFARDRVHLPDDTVVETIRSPTEQLEELRALREHPPMHLLSEQLNSIAEESHRYAAALAAAAAAQPADPKDVASPASLRSDAAATSSLDGVALPPLPGAAAVVSSPPQVEIQFEDRSLFATAAILFRDRDDRVVRAMRFIGACGMVWKEVA